MYEEKTVIDSIWQVSGLLPVQRGDRDQRREQVAPAAAQGAQAEAEAQEELLRKVVHSIWFIWDRS